MKPEEIFRLTLKFAQFIVTFLLLYAIGFPYWMIVAAGLLVPIYGIYLMFRSPGKTKGGTPYADYKLNAISRSWHKVDISLCLTMSIVCFIFALLLFFFYLKFSIYTSKILFAACSSLLLSILYAINGILLTRKLKSGTIDFPANNKLFITSASKTSPLTQQSNEKEMDFFGSLRKRDESISKYSNSKTKITSDDEAVVRRKSAVPSPEPPKSLSNDDQIYNYQPSKQTLSPQYSIERRPRATSWFTDMGDNKKDVTTTIETNFMTPTDNSKEDHLDAREQYIKSKQYRDFMGPSPNKKNIAKRSSSKIHETVMEDFNEKFAAISASTEDLEDLEKLERSQGKPKIFPAAGSSISENYKPSTTAYARKQVPMESRKESKEQYRISQQPKKSTTSGNPFETSQSSQASQWSSQSELDRVFYSKKPSYGERAIDVGSYKASPVEIIEDERKNSDTHSSGTLDAEATPKAPRHPHNYVLNNQFETSASTQSLRTISVDDSPGMPMKFKPYKSQVSEYHQLPAKIAVKQPVIPQKGVITGIARPYSFQENANQSRDDLNSTPSRSTSSLTESSTQVREASLAADSTASSTIRIDDVDRRNSCSPLRDTSLLTTSTIVNMNSTSIRHWSPSPISSISNKTDSRKGSESRVFVRRESLSDGGEHATPQRKGFDVIIRPRDSSVNIRPQSVTTTEFSPRYNSSSTTLTIKSSPDYTQNRHLSTQF